MRNLNDLSRFRVMLPPNIATLWGVDPAGDAICGAFVLLSPIDRRQLRVIASNGDGWDHVSVSLANRCPRWQEMEFIKRAFFRPDEVAMQLHVPPADHISHHPFCLHLWRPHAGAIPLPPPAMVA
ncbi:MULTISPECIES: hypothetical protein [unclassified Mesorhizobium]|uniref:DUF7694 domain-containing protein n=1 Tax=unclassified Mesorhizobium TaxID=325217 RepID=UPI000FCA3D77|nr:MULTISPECIES: hypothetical protein [unclassified Mesorhizobium]RUV47801.1 hypothetical protein EOA85_34010 [Mesorhizobium sp. M5C.F.Ca.IN.020.29.1.1]TIM56015.1 MAG: hypothetical protein E5Y46_15450 [Mesorhizobium sp.]TIM86938.1 MAG: hypothetical protein E5Y50_13840 [Mesorhizobium sp.]TIR28880.1 MAG: hypothetical protein E5X35_28930 [Mesorhizobium sp.]TIS20450.1 MAG: hypothetical protein E5X07_25370 [Mesorhizobium sp.]